MNTEGQDTVSTKDTKLEEKVLQPLPSEVTGTVDEQTPKATEVSTSKTTKDPERWLVAVDDSVESEWGFNSTINHMDVQNDIIYILSVTWARLSEEEISRKVLVKYGKEAEKYGVINFHLLLGIHREVPQAICVAAKFLRATNLVIGHSPSLSWVNKFLTQSVSKYCYAHSPCAMTAVRSPTNIERVLTSNTFSRRLSIDNLKMEKEREMEHQEDTARRDRKRRGDVLVVAELNQMIYKEIVVADSTFLVEVLFDVLDFRK